MQLFMLSLVTFCFMKAEDYTVYCTIRECTVVKAIASFAKQMCGFTIFYSSKDILSTDLIIRSQVDLAAELIDMNIISLFENHNSSQLFSLLNLLTATTQSM